MDHPVGCGPGGILGLTRLLREHGRALEYDLITLGLRLDDLGTDALTWRDLAVIVEHLPSDSALGRTLGETGRFRLAENLAMTQINLLARMSWQFGGKGKPPEPVYLPGQEPKKDTERILSGTPVPIAEMNRLLGWTNGGERG